MPKVIFDYVDKWKIVNDARSNRKVAARRHKKVFGSREHNGRELVGWKAVKKMKKESIKSSDISWAKAGSVCVVTIVWYQPEKKAILLRLFGSSTATTTMVILCSEIKSLIFFAAVAANQTYAGRLLFHSLESRPRQKKWTNLEGRAFFSPFLDML